MRRKSISIYTAFHALITSTSCTNILILILIRVFSVMSSFEENDDLWFQIYSNYPDQEKTTQLQDQSKIDVCKRFGEGQPVPDANDHTCFNKKVIHREIEKQRRKKMAALSSSLRSLLPPELVKGKRSVGDHINEATKYIKHLEKKIKDSGAKRDRLQSLSISSTTTSCGHGNGSSSNCSANYVTVCCRSMGQVEVILSTGGGFDPGKSQLSSVLKLLLEEGLSVVSCVSTKVNERLLHTIQSQVDNPACFNLSALQQQLSNLFDSAPKPI